MLFVFVCMFVSGFCFLFCIFIKTNIQVKQSISINRIISGFTYPVCTIIYWKRGLKSWGIFPMLSITFPDQNVNSVSKNVVLKLQVSAGFTIIYFPTHSNITFCGKKNNKHMTPSWHFSSPLSSYMCGSTQKSLYPCSMETFILKFFKFFLVYWSVFIILFVRLCIPLSCSLYPNLPNAFRNVQYQFGVNCILWRLI